MSGLAAKVEKTDETDGNSNRLVIINARKISVVGCLLKSGYKLRPNI